MQTSKRCIPVLVALGALSSISRTQTSAAELHVAIPNRAPLQRNAFNTLPLGAIRPKGWLLHQEQIQGSGLSGHLDEIWKDVGPNSGWLGGTGESWERGPYYLDGLLPLAYQLQDAGLIGKAKRWVEWSLNSQRPNGQFGPSRNDDWWPRMVMLKALTQYQEVTGDPRVIPFMTRYFQFELKELPNRPLKDWGKYRWQDNVYSVLWLYNRTGDNELFSLAQLLHDQGYNWEAQFANFRYTAKETREKLGLSEHNPLPEIAMQTHGVNNAMALKAAPIWWLISGDLGDRTALYRQLAMLDKYHGLPNGMFSADEHFAGLDPSQGTELCAVVESMFSYEQAFAALGDSAIGDRLERVSYNALPATLSNDIWSHQYDQQPNQIACTRARREWSTNGPDSNLFGLEPNFGCCTANFHQGWPKLISSLWMATSDGGLVTVAYAPSEVTTNLAGKDISITEETEYPFGGDVRLTIHTVSATTFPLMLRIPGWVESAKITINGGPAVPSFQQEVQKGFYLLHREWQNGDRVKLTFPMPAHVSHWYHNSAVFERGPLVFSLPLKAQWTELKTYGQKSADWEVTPTTKWNYAVELGPCAAKITAHEIGEIPFDAQHPAVTLQVGARELPNWSVRENSAAPVPVSPIDSQSPKSELILIPYGAAKLRITAFPYLNERSTCSATATPAKSGAQ